MSSTPVIHSTFVVERSYPVSPERVFAAFADPAIKRRWFSESKSHHVEAFELDLRPGGKELAQYRFKAGTPFEGVVLTNEGIYQDVIPDQRIVSATRMTFGERRISASLITIELLRTEKGTDLICTHQGAFFEGADGPEMRETGWRVLLERLASELSLPAALGERQQVG